MSPPLQPHPHAAAPPSAPTTDATPHPHGSTTYAVPRLPVPLPAFSLRALPAAPAPGTSSSPSRVFNALPKANDLETLRKQLAAVCQELDRCQAAGAEVRLEKELLVAERTQIIVSLQALTALLSHGDTFLTASDDAAASAMGERVRELRLGLPGGNSVRRLCEESELQPHIQSLSKQLQYLWEQWRLETKGLRQAAAAAAAEAAGCVEERDVAVEEAGQRAATAATAAAREASRQQVDDLEARLRQQREEFDSRLRLMRSQVYESQQEAAAAECEAGALRLQLERLRQQQQQQQEAARSAVDEAHSRAAATELAAAAQRCSGCEAGRQRQDDSTALLQLLQRQLAQALGEKLEAVQQAAQASALTVELQQSKEENRRLQVVIREAEQQLSSMREDVAGVKQRQTELRGRLGQRRQQQ